MANLTIRGIRQTKKWLDELRDPKFFTNLPQGYPNIIMLPSLPLPIIPVPEGDTYYCCDSNFNAKYIFIGFDGLGSRTLSSKSEQLRSSYTPSPRTWRGVDILDAKQH
ncbi:hypothetical protein I7I50_03917 [Histoplasma capsulatum G186AR]|uniref:Uncharacterized protein n=1 Tax=Ajellomyces capsulatus TaxID=5037 RepID=A0A8H8CXD9_AJECA|nr:hypothetical protein I7I52_04825 [Histoplasma capsulatum]QSS74946.1 hypothetical protein I7I50_03917 [Histoplasma capsulatum G186AR]